VLEAAALRVELVTASQARQLSGRPKTDLLTELHDVSSGQGVVRCAASLLSPWAAR
jgi:hypothetical protein